MFRFVLALRCGDVCVGLLRSEDGLWPFDRRSPAPRGAPLPLIWPFFPFFCWSSTDQSRRSGQVRVSCVERCMRGVGGSQRKCPPPPPTQPDRWSMCLARRGSFTRYGGARSVSVCRGRLPRVDPSAQRSCGFTVQCARGMAPSVPHDY